MGRKVVMKRLKMGTWEEELGQEGEKGRQWCVQKNWMAEDKEG